MTTDYIERYGISIQANLSGYSFKVTDSQGTVREHGEGSDIPALFESPLITGEYEHYEISFRTHKCMLVPYSFMPERRDDSVVLRDLLGGYVALDADDEVRHVDLPEYNASLVYVAPSEDSLASAVVESFASRCGNVIPLPEMYYMLKQVYGISHHNRVVASYGDSLLTLVISEGEKLLLCNSYKAEDFTTALYYVFFAIRQFQFNPEVTTIYFRNELDEDCQMMLYRYFSGVEVAL